MYCTIHVHVAVVRRGTLNTHVLWLGRCNLEIIYLSKNHRYSLVVLIVTRLEQINQNLIICTMYCIPIYTTVIVSICYLIVRCMLLKKYITNYARKEFISLFTSWSTVVLVMKFKLFLLAYSYSHIVLKPVIQEPHLRIPPTHYNTHGQEWDINSVTHTNLYLTKMKVTVDDYRDGTHDEDD